jgi:Flp pilus assembly protein TadG
MKPVPIHRRRTRQRGTVAVEFALLSVLFFTALFAIVEIARAMFLWSTAEEVTRHAARSAAIANFSDAAALTQIRQAAIFRTTAGPLALSSDITDTDVQIDFLSLNADNVTTAVVPSPAPCPPQNVINCLNDPHAANCVRFVRARICRNDVGGACAPIAYVPFVSLLSVVFPSGANAVNVPMATSIVPVEAYGDSAGTPGCF